MFKTLVGFQFGWGGGGGRGEGGGGGWVCVTEMDESKICYLCMLNWNAQYFKENLRGGSGSKLFAELFSR